MYIHIYMSCVKGISNIFFKNRGKKKMIEVKIEIFEELEFFWYKEFFFSFNKI